MMIKIHLRTPSETGQEPVTETKKVYIPDDSMHASTRVRYDVLICLYNA